MKNVTIYTDGACSGNPGPGGWCAILIYKSTEKQICGGQAQTTNNQMELLAVIKALLALNEPCIVDLYSDSAYVVNAINNNWLTSWEQNLWRTADNKPVKNLELWQQLKQLLAVHKVNFIKVKGHADNKYNNLCDKVAQSERLKYTN